MILVIAGLAGAAILAAGSAAFVRTRARTQQRIESLARSLADIRRHGDETARQQLRLELALSSMTQGAVICDEGGAVVLRNEFARSFVDGRHGDALVGVAIEELLADARTGEPADREIEVFGPPSRTLFVHATPLEDHGVPMGAIATVDDITEQQRIDAIRRDFVANISHELKTPVGALALLAETITDEGDVDVVRRLAGRMRDESFRVSRVIDDLLALSHIEGDGAQELGPVRLVDVVAEAVDRVRPAAEQADVRIEIAEIPPSLALHGDRRQLTSALFNLLENAIKYSDRGSVVEVRAAGDDSEVAFVVQDHGIGIPSKDLQRIFERFYRVDQARSRVTGGTGLGLAIVRHVARNHGGQVTVSSREGEGSTFMLVLPTAVGAARPAEAVGP